MKHINLNLKKKAIEPLITVILLIVVSVILVLLILSFSTNFSSRSLNKTENFGELKISDATHFVFPKSAVDGVVQFTYSPPTEIKKDINITHYRVINIPEMTEPVALSESKILSSSLNILELPCLYEYSTTTPDLYIQLITADNTYIDIKTKDAGMMCTPGGDGSEENPKIICTAEDLNAVRLNLDWNHALGKDIDLQCFSRRDVNGWEPIGNDEGFYGNLDGRNRTIKNMYINLPENDNIGLISAISLSLIKNLSFLNVEITGENSVGCIAGYVGDSFLDNLSCSGEIIGNYDVGGLVGLSYNSKIQNSYSIANVTGTTNAGGLVGYAAGEIINNYALGNVSGEEGIGGFIGTVADDLGDVTIINNYSAGLVLGEENTGGFIGKINESEINQIYENNFWDTITSEQLTNVGNAGGRITSEMKTQGTFTDWDFSTIWTIEEGRSYPYLRTNKQQPSPMSTLNVWGNWTGKPDWNCNFERSFTITLYSNGDKIYYTINGSLPSCDLGENPNQLEYENEITITTDPRITGLQAITCEQNKSSEIKQYACEGPIPI